MSLRQVLTIYNAERQLSDDETALLNTLRRMSDSDRQMFIDGLAGKSSQKKSSKKSAEKSRRAQGMQSQLNTRLAAHDRQRGNGNAPDDRCSDCGAVADDNVHHKKTDPDYHPFVSTAQPAEPSSNQATSEIGRGVVGDAHYAASSGD